MQSSLNSSTLHLKPSDGFRLTTMGFHSSSIPLQEFSSYPPTSSPPASGLTSVSSDLGVPSLQREQRAPPHPLSVSESLLTQTSFRLHSQSESSTESSSAPCDTPKVNFCPFWATSTSHYAHPSRVSLYLQLTIHRFLCPITVDLHLPE